MVSWKVTVMTTGQDTNSTRARKVMIVDDDRNLSLLVATTLQIGGFEVVTAQDGETALDRIETEQIDAIVLDLRMPGMGGRNFYRELRSRGVDVPVLIASAYGARGAQNELGAEGAIEKPFDPERLLDAVQRLLK
jgi:DNA-binding response OmpR family regulator